METEADLFKHHSMQCSCCTSKGQAWALCISKKVFTFKLLCKVSSKLGILASSSEVLGCNLSFWKLRIQQKVESLGVFFSPKWL